MNEIGMEKAMQRIGDELNRPAWQLPPGVSRGSWDYANEQTIATEYDAFHTGHPLLKLDRELVLEEAARMQSARDRERWIAMDLGCGTGRVLLPLAQRGWSVLGIDLSQAMLQQVAAKRQAASESGQDDAASEIASRIGLVRGNLVQLQFLKSARVDLAYCLYSSLGMVQGRQHRQEVIRHVARSLRPGGTFIVHVHNRGTWIRDPGGVRRWISDWWRSLRDKQWEFGDRVYTYRGLPSMYLHIYSERELREDLRQGGLRIVRWLRLNRTSSGLLAGSLGSRWRAGGFIAVAQRPASPGDRGH